MKKLLKTLLIVCLLFSCSNEDDKYGITENQSLFTVKIMNDISSKQAVLEKTFKSIKLFEDVTEMKNFKLTEDTFLNKKFIQGEGINKSGDYIVFRMEVEIKQLENGIYQFSQKSLFGESCSGVNCTKCAFADGGGCDCKKRGSNYERDSYCNHSISRE